jgi:oligogalacturonide lyase
MKNQSLRLPLFVLFLITYLAAPIALLAQPVLETGSQKPMPNEWIDKDTHHKVICLSRMEGNSLSFYFHNYPFLQQTSKEGDRMVFYNTGKNGKQGYTVNLKTLKIEQITNQDAPMTGEIVGHKSHNIYYQKKDSVFVSNIDTKKSRLVFVFPSDFKGSISTLNADETMLAGGRASDEQKAILKQYPEKSQFFNRIFDAHLLNQLFTINIKTGELKKIHEEKTWLGHIQFSPTMPNLLMFCHEGPWHKVDRIWTIDVKTGVVQLMHKRSMDNEIAGHEFFSPDGKTIWFDLQVPRSENFFLAGSSVKDHSEIRYRMTRDEWSIHFNVTLDQKLFAGDGGDAGQVAKAKDGMWIYLFRPNGDHFDSERLVNMKYHGYKLEPNVHFSPDGKWVIFRANFEGVEKVYAVEIARTVKK